MARRVGPNGLVYAQDVQPEMLAAISRRVQREGLANVRTRLGRGSDPYLPADTFDAVLIVDVVHEIEDRVTLFTNLRRALTPDGSIGVVDFRPAVVTSSQVHVRVQTSFTLDPGRSAGRLGWRVPVASIDTDRSRPVPSSSSPRTSAPF